MKRFKLFTTLVLATILVFTSLGGGSIDASIDKNKKVKQYTIDEITTLKVPDVNKGTAKVKGEKTHKDALKLLKDFIKEHNINIKADLDDKVFQQFIFQFAFGHEQFTEEENAKLVELVRFVDLYENYEDNEKILEFRDKIKKGTQLENEEITELESLMPVSTTDKETKEYTSMSDDIQEKVGEVLNSSASASSYSGTKARDYAYSWWNKRNNTQYPYYKNYYGCTSCWNDCTNFVSQALKAGGKREIIDPVFASDQWNWFYRNSKPSHSWGGAHNFYNHWKHRATLASGSSQLVVGDVVQADFGGDGKINHTALITKVSSGSRYVTQHTTDKKDAALKAWYDSGYKVYGWRMGTGTY